MCFAVVANQSGFLVEMIVQQLVRVPLKVKNKCRDSYRVVRCRLHAFLTLFIGYCINVQRAWNSLYIRKCIGDLSFRDSCHGGLPLVTLRGSRADWVTKAKQYDLSDDNLFSGSEWWLLTDVSLFSIPRGKVARKQLYK